MALRVAGLDMLFFLVACSCFLHGEFLFPLVFVFSRE
jgi:hypothetical protein